ncbi:hypothetical protein [Granulicella tundricola]|uniref:Glycosyl transferase n=1 Tax=Granulicella tundricola (strain ATCC BAA-1859 / DSM 23138 / MP5ACTX9) TaxID=1198114 RepID=E8WW48_GRATM|nr:hypothetical protein [Granulicella tundricola]ADW67354.1 hypothetical protein AciX9_0282 [Granulicella tundricola MP5ACTX9]
MTESTSRAACTIVSPNYLAYARTIATSYLAQHPGHRFFVLLVADLADTTAFAAEPYTAVAVNEIGLPDLPAEAMKYDILELNTNVKPTFLKYLIARYSLTRLVYLDPDIFCYAPLTPVFDALETHDAVLTPHITTPVFDGKTPGEQDLLFNGTYNLGFIAVRNTPESLRLLDWWERRCLDLGYSEGRTGLFVDQKWMNLAPGLFEQVKILRHPGCNMAYWNLHERSIAASAPAYAVRGPDGESPLCFFHFSGIVPSDPAVLSKHTDRFTLAQRTDLTQLFADYKAQVLANSGSSLEAIPYGFDTFPDGTTITRLCRRLYAKHQAHFSDNPFIGAWSAYARKQGLVAGKAAPQKATWKDFSSKDRRVEMVHTLLRTALRILGPNRYELLMRYLAHIAVLRNQSVFLNKGLPPQV